MVNIANAGETERIHWEVLLYKRSPNRLLLILASLALGACIAWILFAAVLPTLAALALLSLSSADYILPLSYRITSDGVSVSTLISYKILNWDRARRLIPEKDGFTITPLGIGSRLDSFRGVRIRYAPEGEIGDSDSLRRVLAEYAPHLLRDLPGSGV